VEQHDIGVELSDEWRRLGDRARFADDVDEPGELAAYARAEQLVVVDQHDADHDSPPLGIDSSTSVPLPGDEVIVADPPARRSLDSMDSEIPRRSAATVPGSN